MRMSLGGNLPFIEPEIIRLYNDIPFIPAPYISRGFVYYEVVCIGGPGGRGSGGNAINDPSSEYKLVKYGGAGGAGGISKTKGLLRSLPASCPVTVGIPGADEPFNRASGDFGGDSSFNVNTCVASGGKGGANALGGDSLQQTQADGGSGGHPGPFVIGEGPGSGVPGGDCGVPGITGPLQLSTPGQSGSSGGGGGAGGVGNAAGVQCLPATAGGDSDTVPGDPPRACVITGIPDLVPGGGGGHLDPNGEGPWGMYRYYGSKEGAVFITLSVD